MLQVSAARNPAVQRSKNDAERSAAAETSGGEHEACSSRTLGFNISFKGRLIKASTLLAVSLKGFCVWFLGVLSPQMWPAAVLGSGSAHRVYEWSGGAGRKPSNQSHPDQHHHLPTGSTRYFICVHVAMPLVHFLFCLCCVFFYYSSL